MPSVALSAVVMSHPRRAHLAEELSRRNPRLDLRVVTDPEPERVPSAWRTARRAWSAVAEGSTHHLVLQDDVHLAPDLVDRLHELVAERPDDALCLFAEWGSRTASAIRLAAMHGHGWAPVVDDYVPCQALVLPSDVARGFDAFAAAESTETTPDDVVLLEYLARRGVTAYAAVANLVDHDSTESLVGNSTMGVRRSVGFTTDPAERDHRPSVLVGLQAVPYYCWWEQQAVLYVPDATTTDGWGRLRWQPAVDALGITAADVQERFDDAFARLPHRAVVLDRLNPVVVVELWRTAYLLGVVAAGLPGSPSTGTQGARRTLRTLTPGALRRVVPVAWLEPLADLLEPLLVAGVHAGAADAAHRTDLPEAVAAAR